MVGAMSALGGTSFREQIRRSLAGAAPEAELEGPRTAAIALILLEHQAALGALADRAGNARGRPFGQGTWLCPAATATPPTAISAPRPNAKHWKKSASICAHTASAWASLDNVPFRGVPIAVRPYVYLLGARPTLLLSNEVRKALVPIAPSSPGWRHHACRFQGDQRFEFPAWDIDGHRVWGLTYRVLDEFFRR